MAIKPTQRGFALLLAVIFMAVMLTFGLALGSLSYKQQVLASTSVESQYAFYAADSGLECALYADQQLASFTPYPQSDPGASTPNLSCDGATVSKQSSAWNSISWKINYRVSIDAATTRPRCADISIYKYSTPQANGETTYLFSQGYDVSCAVVASEGSNPTGARFSSRGISAHY